jgi:hypothetical protein
MTSRRLLPCSHPQSDSDTDLNTFSLCLPRHEGNKLSNLKNNNRDRVFGKGLGGFQNIDNNLLAPFQKYRAHYCDGEKHKANNQASDKLQCPQNVKGGTIPVTWDLFLAWS